MGFIMIMENLRHKIEATSPMIAPQIPVIAPQMAATKKHKRDVVLQIPSKNDLKSFVFFTL
jgi:hypothetical protein